MRPNKAVLLLLILSIPIAMLSSIPAQSTPIVRDWPQFKYDIGRTGYSPGSSPSTNASLWQTLLLGDVVSSPAVSGGVVYVGSYDRRVYALRIADGGFIWNYTTSGRVESSPAIAGGRLFVGSDDKRVYALNATTGALLWKYLTGSWVVSSPTLADGLVIVGSLDGSVYALNSETGSKVWKYTTNGSVFSSPAVFGGKVFVGSSDGNLTALDLLTGSRVWNYTTGGAIYSTPAVQNGVVYVGSADGYLYALSAATGAFKWSYHTSSFIVSSPALAYGKVFFGSYDKKVYGLRQTDGGLIWRYSTGSYVSSDPSVAAGRVIVGSYDGYLYALNETTGSVLWKYDTGGSVVASPAIAEGKVFIGSKSDYLFALGDGLPPTTTINIGTPSFTHDDTTYVSANTPLTLSPSDNVGISETQFKIDAGPWTKYTAPFTLAGQTDGIHSIYFNSTDLSGNVEETNTQRLYLDKTPPSSTVTLPLTGVHQEDGRIYATPSAPFTILASDEGSGVKETAFRIDTGPWTHYTAPFSLAGRTDGTHIVEFNSTDNVQNHETTQHFNIILDSTPPETSASYVEATQAVTLWATDSGAGVKQTVYRIDGSPWTEYQIPLVILELGSHTINYYSVDNLGNAEEVAALTFTVPRPTSTSTTTPPPVTTFEGVAFALMVALLPAALVMRALSKKSPAKRSPSITATRSGR